MLLILAVAVVTLADNMIKSSNAAETDTSQVYGTPSPIALMPEPTISGIEKNAKKLCGVAEQGGMVFGSVGEYDAVYNLSDDGKKVSSGGIFVVGIDRDAVSPLKLEFVKNGNPAKKETFSYNIKKHDYITIQKQRINVPPYPPSVKKRINQENAELAAARRAAASDDAVYFVNLAYPENLKKFALTTQFGTKRTYNKGQKDERSSVHNAIDIDAPAGTVVHPIGAGTVIYAYHMYESGNTVVISHGHNITSTYCHLKKMNVNVGDAVTPDDVIGLSGNTGASTTGAHVHFQMGDGFMRLNPQVILNIPVNPKTKQDEKIHQKIFIQKTASLRRQ